MRKRLQEAVNANFPSQIETLKSLVAVPSVSANDPDQVRKSAEQVAGLLEVAGLREVRLLEIEGAHPAVFGHIPAPEGAPTVLLYAHHDVQPPGPGWERDPFVAIEEDGRLYGRGAADDKGGIIMHLATLEAFEGSPPVGIKVFIEGEEEIGSAHLPQFLQEHGDLLEADVIVIADAGNWKTGVPAFTTSLRGLVSCIVEVRTLEAAVHSGSFGGVYPDAITSLARVISKLHNDNGTVAVDGLLEIDLQELELTEAELAAAGQPLEGVHLLGTGSLTSRTWAKPSISVLAVDAPPIHSPVNAIVPSAKAVVSMRIAPGQDPQEAMDLLTSHIEASAPWGAHVSATPKESGESFLIDTSGPSYPTFRAAFTEAFGTEVVDMGVGGSIPFVASFSEAMPDADILLVGASDPQSRAHGPNESVHLEDLRKSCLAQVLALYDLANT
jgi:acetylornithine deacetylase/succinyl-diaminopimelate desuccinylase-like protein